MMKGYMILHKDYTTKDIEELDTEEEKALKFELNKSVKKDEEPWAKYGVGFGIKVYKNLFQAFTEVNYDTDYMIVEAEILGDIAYDEDVIPDSEYDIYYTNEVKTVRIIEWREILNTLHNDKTEISYFGEKAQVRELFWEELTAEQIKEIKKIKNISKDLYNKLDELI